MKKYKIINGILGCLMNALAIAAIQTIGFSSLNAFERQLSTSMAIDQMSGSAQYIDYAPMIRCGSAPKPSNYSTLCFRRNTQRYQ